MSKKYTSDDIQSHSAREHVQLRPKLYFEKCFTENSLNALVFDVLCHAIDEYFDGNCSEIELTIWKNSFFVRYNTGISLAIHQDNLTLAEIIMTQVRACSNLKKHLAVGEEFCGLGIATVNFAASLFKLTTAHKNKKGVFVFENGETQSKNTEPYENNDSWTEMYVEPNPKLFGRLAFSAKGITEKIDELKLRLTQLNFVVDNKIS